MDDSKLIAFLDDRFGALQRGMDERFDGVQKQMDARFGTMQQSMDVRFDRVDGRLDRVDGRLDRVEGRLDRVEGRLDHVEEEVRAAHIEIEGLRGTIQMVAEGVTTVDQKLDRFREETAQNFADVRSEMRFIDKRVTALERKK